MKSLSFLILGIFTLALAGCSDAPVGSKKRPFTMYFIPSVDTQQIAATADHAATFVQKYVSQKLYSKDDGFYVKTAIPASYIAVVEAFGTKKADFAAMTTFSYILAKDIKKYPIEAALTVLRDNGEKTYKAQIIVKADSGIKTLQDLKGKKFAYTDPASTSGFILPAQLFKDLNIQLGETVFAQKHDNVVTMVYQGQVDAGATYYSPPLEETVNGKTVSKIRDARARVLTQFPDVEQKVKIIGFTQDIPNEPWVIRSNLYKDPVESEKVKKLVTEALLDFAKTEDGKKMIEVLATGSALVSVTDETYADIRKIVLAASLNLEQILTKPTKKN